MLYVDELDMFNIQNRHKGVVLYQVNEEYES